MIHKVLSAKKIIFILCILSNTLSAQELVIENTSKLSTSISGEYLFGGQIYNDAFFYNSGFGIHAQLRYSINPQLELGGGLGHLKLENERFIPVYFDMIHYKNDKKNSSCIQTQIGYSKGTHITTQQLDNYKFKGGPYISIGIGRKIFITDNLSSLIIISYKHQFAQLSYEGAFHNTHSEILNYDIISCSLYLKYL